MGSNVSTYYKRLNVLRTELIEGSEKQSIVPVSVSSSIAVPQNNAVSDTDTNPPKNNRQISAPATIHPSSSSRHEHSSCSRATTGLRSLSQIESPPLIFVYYPFIVEDTK